MKSIKILLIEDNPAFVRLITEQLSEIDEELIELDSATGLEEGYAALSRKNYDAILLDLHLPEESGVKTFDRVNSKYPSVPIIVLTGIDDKTLARDLVQRGAQDFLIKGEHDSGQLIRSLLYAIERKRLEQSLNSYRDQLEDLVEERTAEVRNLNENIKSHINQLTSAERELEFNRAKFAEFLSTSNAIFIEGVLNLADLIGGNSENILGYSHQQWREHPEGILGFWADNIHPDDRNNVVESCFSAMRRGEDHDLEYRMIAADGREVWFHDTVRMHTKADGEKRFFSVMVDITELRKTEAELSRERTLLSRIISASPTGIVMVDKNGVIQFANARVGELIGTSSEKLVGNHYREESWEIFNIKGEPLRDDERPLNYVLKTGNQLDHFRLQFQRPGKDAIIVGGAFPLFGENGQVEEIVFNLSDVTETEQMQRRLELDAAVFRNSGEAILITNAAAEIIEVNDAFVEVTGYSPEEAIGKTPGFMKSGRHDFDFYKEMWAELSRDGTWSGEIWDRKKSGEVYPKLLSISAKRDTDGDVTNYIGIFRDITKSKNTEWRLKQLAQYDYLTSLPNRYLFEDRLEQAIISADRSGTRAGLLFLDLDGFKTVNDSLGHKQGDELLVEVAARLSAAIRQIDTVARLGGDEFTIVLKNLEHPGMLSMVADRIVESMKQPFNIDGQTAYVGASIGIAIYPEDGEDSATLLKNADSAMYHAKSMGRGKYSFYARHMNEQAARRLDIETKLRQAIMDNSSDITFHFQPIVLADDGALAGAEALIRWNDPELGDMPPLSFIPLAEQSDLINLIGRRVLSEAVSSLADWKSILPPEFILTVNLSARQLHDPGFFEFLRELIQEKGVDPANLGIELTETSLMETESGEVVSFLQSIDDLGVALLIDDFGVGYSSLSYLRRTPIGMIKIDKSFVENIPEDKDSIAICRAIISMAHNLSINVVAEGIETEEQASLISNDGAKYLQGFYFNKPMPKNEFEKLLESPDNLKAKKSSN